jgi:hypothetical protein
MADNKATIAVVLQDGVFIPQADVSHLADGTSIDIDVPTPDDWDLLLEAINAEDDLTQELIRGCWDDLGSDAERWVIDSDEWLVWNLMEVCESAGILI